jgi:hypothetical protein
MEMIILCTLGNSHGKWVNYTVYKASGYSPNISRVRWVAHEGRYDSSSGDYGVEYEQNFHKEKVDKCWN